MQELEKLRKMLEELQHKTNIRTGKRWRPYDIEWMNYYTGRR
jgi:hypothetical protein